MRIRQSFLWAFVVVAAALAVAAAFLTIVIAPNRFKGKIEDAVTRATGQPLRLTGDISFHITRWLSLATAEGEWGQATSTTARGPLAEWHSALVRVRLLPLLQGRVVLDTIRADGLRLRIHRDLSGHLDWAIPEREAAPKRTGTPRQLAIGGLDLSHATLDYTDDVAGFRLNLANVRFTAGAWSKGAEVRARAQFQAVAGRASAPPSAADLQASVDLTSRIQTADDFSRVALHATSLSAHLSGGQLVSGGIDTALDMPRLSAVLKPVSIDVPTYAVDVEHAQLTGSVDLEYAADNTWHARGPVKIVSPASRQLLKDLGLDLPLPRDPAMLDKIAADATWEIAAGALTVQPLTVQLDATRIDGRVERTSGPMPRVTFDLHGDLMDLGAYADLKSSHPAPFELPVASLRALNAQGQLVIERARLADAQLKRVTLKVESHE